MSPPRTANEMQMGHCKFCLGISRSHFSDLGLPISNPACTCFSSRQVFTSPFPAHSPHFHLYLWRSRMEKVHWNVGRWKQTVGDILYHPVRVILELEILNTQTHTPPCPSVALLLTPVILFISSDLSSSPFLLLPLPVLLFALCYTYGLAAGNTDVSEAAWDWRSHLVQSRSCSELWKGNLTFGQERLTKTIRW